MTGQEYHLEVPLVYLILVVLAGLVEFFVLSTSDNHLPGTSHESLVGFRQVSASAQEMSSVAP